MKKMILAVILSTALFTLGCKKQNDTLTKTDLLCGKSFKKWKVVGYQRSLNTPVTNSTPDILSTIASAYRDNNIIFYPDGVEKLNEGATGSNPNQDYRNVNWVFMDNETTINCWMLFGILGNSSSNSSSDSQLNFKITELTDSKMVLDNEFLFNPDNYYNRWTLVPVN